jgi:hypothetical protein
MARQHSILTWSGSSAVITGILLGEADTFAGSIWTDQPGTLYLEQSGDGNHWDQQTSYLISASTAGNPGSGFTEPAILAYGQVRFVPTSTNPGTFRLYVSTKSAGTQM